MHRVATEPGHLDHTHPSTKIEQTSAELIFISAADSDLSLVAQAWLPMNALFVAMLCSGFLALCYISVPMVQTLKNVANLVTVAGDWYFFGETVSVLSITAIFIMCTIYRNTFEIV